MLTLLFMEGGLVSRHKCYRENFLNMVLGRMIVSLTFLLTGKIYNIWDGGGAFLLIIHQNSFWLLS